MNNIFFTGPGLLFMLTMLLIIATVIALYIYRPHIRHYRYGGMIIVVFIIVGTAGFQVLSSYNISTPKDSDQLEVYKLADWALQDNQELSSLYIKHKWEENPNPEGKMFYAFSLLKNKQTERGKQLLQELVDHTHKKDNWFHPKVVKELIKDVSSYEKEIQDKNNPQQETEPFYAADIDEEISAYKEKFSKDNKVDVNVLDKVARFDVDYMQMLASSGDNEALSELQSDFRDEISGSENGESKKIPHYMQKEYAKVNFFFGNDIEAEELLVDYIMESPADAEAIALLSEIYLSGDVELSDKAVQLPQYHHAKLRAAREKVKAFSLWQKQEETSSETAMIHNQENDYNAKKELNTESLNPHKKKGTISDIVTNMNTGFLDNENDENYQDENEDDDVEFDDDENEGSGDAGETLTEDGIPIYLIEDNDTLANELTYTLIESTGISDKNADLSIRLSRYYYNKGDNDKAKKEIHQLLGKEDLLTTSEQYIMNTIDYNNQKLKRSSDTDSFTNRQAYLQEIYQAKEDLYNRFHTPKYRDEPNTSEESFEYFLSDSIRNPKDESISIMSAEAQNDGSVSMYVSADNISSLAKEDMTLSDNNETIEDFKLEKISSVSDKDGYGRSIGMVIDVSGSMRGERIEIAKSSSKSFIRDVEEYEQLELVSFETSPSLVQGFTKNKGALLRGIDGLNADGGTNITDALLFEMDQIKNQDGQKVIFIFSDGEDNHFSQVESRAQIIDKANQSGITIFAVGFGAGYETLSEVAKETGGEYVAAPNTATINEGFQTVEKKLRSTYKLTYQLKDPEDGHHVVTLDYKDLTAKKDYILGELDEDEGEDIPVNEEETSFKLYQLSPNTIYKGNNDDIDVTLKGENLTNLESLSIGDISVDIDEIVDDETVNITIPDNITIGQHVLVARNHENEEATTELIMSKAGLKDQITFGWATLYADMCQPDGDEMNCIGSPNIDHFIYPEGSKMTLTNKERLTFNGANFEVEGSKLLFFKNSFSGNGGLNGKLEMTKADQHGEEFDLKYDGSNRLSFNKLGIKVDLNEMMYTAHHDKKPGTYKAETGLDGIDNPIFDSLNMEKIKILETVAPLLTTDMGLQLRISPREANIKGDIDLGSMDVMGFDLGDIEGTVEYDDLNKRYSMAGDVSDFSIFDISLDQLPLGGIGATIGYEYPNGLAFGMDVTGNMPLGTTGLSIQKLGGLIDTTSRKEGNLELDIATVVDKPVKSFVKKVNSIKVAKWTPFEIDPKDLNLLKISLSGGVTKFLTSDWEAKGEISGELLGFEVGKANTRVNNNLLQFGLSSDIAVLEMNGESTLVYENPDAYSRLTIDSQLKVMVDLLLTELSGEIKTHLVPSDISDSNVEIDAKAGVFTFSISTDELKLFK